MPGARLVGAAGQPLGRQRRRGREGRTDMIVAVLDDKGHALAVEARAATGLAQAVAGAGDVAEELAVGEAAARRRVHHGRGPRVVARNGLEDGQPRERRQHPRRRGAYRAPPPDARRAHRRGGAAGGRRCVLVVVLHVAVIVVVIAIVVVAVVIATAVEAEIVIVIVMLSCSHVPLLGLARRPPPCVPATQPAVVTGRAGSGPVWHGRVRILIHVQMLVNCTACRCFSAFRLLLPC